jgi:hypothetical protein
VDLQTLSNGIKMTLREKVSFIRVTQDQDSTGQLVNTETVYYEPKGARVRTLSASTDVIVQQQNQTSLIEVTIRYNPTVAILNGDIILWRGFRFNSMSPIIDEMRTWVTIKAFSEIETTSRENAQS